MRKSMILLAVLVATGCSVQSNSSMQFDVTVLEQAVWTDFFASGYPGTDGDYIHLNSSTGIPRSYDAWKEGLEDYLSKKFDDVSPDTVASFVKVNATTLEFPKHIEFTRGVIIDHHNEIDDIFSQDGDVWEIYYKTHPKGQGRRAL